MFLLAVGNLSAQSLSLKINKTTQSVKTAFDESFGWYDLPVGFAYLSAKHFPLTLGEKINVPPSGFDRNLSSSISVPGSNSFGSIDQNIYPYTILYLRVAANLGGSLFTDWDVDHYDFKHTFVFYKVLIYNYTFTELIKNLTDRDRPNNEDDRSFFSGHTSLTFATSSFLYREVDDFLDDWSVTKHDDVLRTSLKVGSFAALYGWASYVGYSRMRDSKHYFTDVLIGATVGTLIGNFLYDSYLTEDESIISNINVGVYNNTPTIGFSLVF